MSDEKYSLLQKKFPLEIAKNIQSYRSTFDQLQVGKTYEIPDQSDLALENKKYGDDWMSLSRVAGEKPYTFTVKSRSPSGLNVIIDYFPKTPHVFRDDQFKPNARFVESAPHTYQPPVPVARKPLGKKQQKDTDYALSLLGMGRKTRRRISKKKQTRKKSKK